MKTKQLLTLLLVVVVGFFSGFLVKKITIKKEQPRAVVFDSSVIDSSFNKLLLEIDSLNFHVDTLINSLKTKNDAIKKDYKHTVDTRYIYDNDSLLQSIISITNQPR